MRNEPFIAQFIEHFRKRGPQASPDVSAVEELWLVFADEGLSLQQHLYTLTAPSTPTGPDTGPYTADPPTGDEDDAPPDVHDDVHDLDADELRYREQFDAPGSDSDTHNDSDANRESAGSNPGASVRVPSAFWHKMRADGTGALVLHTLVHHLLVGVETCHRHGIVHRDIKLSNLILNTHQLVRHLLVYDVNCFVK